MRQELTHEFVSSALRLEDGRLYWKIGRGGVRVGQPIKKVNSDGYLALGLAGKTLLAHRVVWFLVNGEWPGGPLDHVNRNKLDNRIENLRLASSATNRMNTPAKPGKRFRGVTRLRYGAYQAQCAKKYLGSYKSEEAAAAAYNRYAASVYGEFAVLNNVDEAEQAA